MSQITTPTADAIDTADPSAAATIKIALRVRSVTALRLYDVVAINCCPNWRTNAGLGWTGANAPWTRSATCINGPSVESWSSLTSGDASISGRP